MTIIGSQGLFTSPISGSLMNATEGKYLAQSVDCDPVVEVVEVDCDPAIDIVGDGFVEQESGLATSQRRNQPSRLAKNVYHRSAEIAGNMACGAADFFSFFLPVEFAGNNVGELRDFFSSVYEQITTPRAVWEFEDALNNADWKAAEEALKKDNSPRFLKALCRELPYAERRNASIPAAIIRKALNVSKDGACLEHAFDELLRCKQWPQALEVIGAMNGSYDNNNPQLRLLTDHIQFALSHYVKIYDVYDSVPLQVLSGGCLLYGDLGAALHLFRRLLRRSAESAGQGRRCGNMSTKCSPICAPWRWIAMVDRGT